MGTLVLFGATGDLCKKKLIPALQALHEKSMLPADFKIIGAARRDRTTETWLKTFDNLSDDFSSRCSYYRCDLSSVETLKSLPVEGDTTFFLSVPPETYSDAIRNLKASGLVDDPDRSRVVIEKPFGHNLKSAHALQSVVTECLREKQVYRIDHYLGKDTVNNLLATRFSNTVFEPLWNRNFIEEVQIFATETIGCEGRSQYYDGSGAVRDMLQNHLLQIIALVAMEPPSKINATEVRREKVKVLSATRLGDKYVAGQYEQYQFEEGVPENTITPTFIAGDLYIDNWRWHGVPFYFMTGKRLPYQCVEVVIKLKAPPLNLYKGHEYNDRITIRFQPDAHLDLRIDIKSPGLEEKVEPAVLSHAYPDGALDGYVRLLYEALNQDQSHFVHSEEVLESWRIVDDLLCSEFECPIRTYPYIYRPGAWGPEHKTQFITKWDYPS